MVDLKQKKNGFTLVELLVVISIIALLLAILMPSLQKVREQAKRISCSSKLKQLALGMVMYAYDNKDKLPLSGGSHFLNLWEPSVLDSFCSYAGVEVNQAADVDDKYSKLFSCPSRKADFYMSAGRVAVDYELTTYGPMYSWWGSAYYNSWTVEPPRKISQTKALGRKPGYSAQKPLSKKMLSDMTFFNDRSPNYWAGNHIRTTFDSLDNKSKIRGGGNAAFLDTHVEWIPIQKMQQRQVIRGYTIHLY